MITVPETTSANPALHRATSSAMLVSMSTANYHFYIDTEFVNGVYQVAPSDDHDTVADTPEGSMRVVSCAAALADSLGLALDYKTDEPTLIVVENGGELAALRVSSVSRPIEVARCNMVSLPGVSAREDSQRIVRSVVLQRASETVQSSLPGLGNKQSPRNRPDSQFQLEIDPLALLGLGSPERNGFERTEPVSRLASSRCIAVGHRAEQILAFCPEEFQSEAQALFFLPISQIAEVLEACPIWKSPLPSRILRGYVLWRDIPVPVIALGAAFSAESASRYVPSRDRRLIIARIPASRLASAQSNAGLGDRLVAFFTQSQMQAMRVPDSTAVRCEQFSQDSYRAAFETEMGTMIMPSLGNILDGRV